jgi:hemerythrin superfamily protein
MLHACRAQPLEAAQERTLLVPPVYITEGPMAARKQSTARKQSSSKSSSSKKASRGSSGKKLNALTLLQQDHKLVKELFDKFEKTKSEDKKAQIAEQICQELKVHAQIEEEIFYPSVREEIREEDLIDEATVEHQSAKDLIAQIEGEGPEGELFEAKVKVLGEYIQHHVKEEQNELFPQVRKTKVDLQALGERLQARKMELQGGGDMSSGAGLEGSQRSRSKVKEPM